MYRSLVTALVLFTMLTLYARAQVIEISPSTASLTPGSTQSVTVSLTVPPPAVTTVSVTLDVSANLEIVDGSAGIEPATLWNLVIPPTVENNRIEYTLGSLPSGGEARGCLNTSCELFQFSVRAISEGTGAITFVQGSTEAFDTESNEVSLTTFVDASIIIGAVISPEGREVSGVLSDLVTGEPVGGATVTLMNADTEGLIASTTTAADGSYTVEAPDSSTSLRLEFSEDDYDTVVLDGFTAPSSMNVQIQATVPNTPTGLTARVGGDSILLEWDANGEPDIDGYFMYRSTSATGQFTPTLNSEPVDATRFEDMDFSQGQTWFYKLSAIDVDENESPLTDPLEVTADGITVVLPEVAGEAGAEVRVPISVENASGISPAGMDFHLVYPPELVALEFDEEGNVIGGVEVEPTAITAQTSFLFNSRAPGRLLISALQASGLDPLVGDGKLAEVVFTLEDGGANCAELSLADFNDPSAGARMGAQINDTNGEAYPVNYGGLGELCIDANCLIGDLNGDGSVSSADATLSQRLAILDITLEDLDVPEDCRNKVADVNADQRLNTQDAVVIQRIALGLPVNPPQEGKAGSDATAAKLLKGSPGVMVSITDAEAKPGETFEVSLNLSDATAVSGFQASIALPGGVEFVEASPGENLGVDSSALSKTIERNVIGLSLAEFDAAAGEIVELARIELALKEEATSNGTPTIRVSDILLTGEYAENLAWYQAVSTVAGNLNVLPKQPGEGEGEGEGEGPEPPKGGCNECSAYGTTSSAAIWGDLAIGTLLFAALFVSALRRKDEIKNHRL